VHSPFERGDTFEIKSRFDLNTRMFGDGIMPATLPTGPRILMRPLGPFAIVQNENRRQDYYCHAGSYAESIRLTLPEGKTLTKLPKDEAVTHALGEYHSSYRMDGNVLVASRRVVWRLPGSVCTPQMADQLALVSRAIERDTSSRLVLVDARPVTADPAAHDKPRDLPSPAADVSGEAEKGDNI
jgi:hypothetical protein